MSMNDEEQLVKDGIIQGDYTTKRGHGGAFYRVFDDVLDEEDQKFGFYSCRACSIVIACKPGGGTGKLNRHADKCDPLEVVQPKQSSILFRSLLLQFMIELRVYNSC